MASLTIVAHIKAKDGKVGLVRNELEKLIDITRAEEGCIEYDLHQDNDAPAHFMFFENWTNRDLWQAHTGNDHVKAFMEATEGAVEEFTLHEMTKIA